jgi:hypothetical protein
LQLLNLFGLQRLADDVGHSIFAQHARQRQENLAFNSMLTLKICNFEFKTNLSSWTYCNESGNCKNVVGVAQNGLHKGGHAQPDGPGGVALEPNHFVSAEKI